jgi:hypothetical protein
MAQYLAQVIGMHGWPCDAVADYRATPGEWTSVTCRNGETYEVFLRDDWDWHGAERQTRLEPMLEIGKYTEQLTSDDAADRRQAAVALASLGPDAGPAVPALAAALADQDATVRQAAADALRQIGPSAGAAVPALTQALDDPDPGVRDSATQALTAIHGEE